MARDFYSIAVARRSLRHFVVGKLLSAVIGISFLLLTVRAMEPSEYGRYVAVLAMGEIFYLVTGLGLSTIAQRYVAEYRMRAVADDFFIFLRAALRRRLLLSIGFVLALVVLWSPLMALTGLTLEPRWRAMIALLLVASSGVSFLEEIMGALLLQGYAQALGVARNFVKLLLVASMLLAGSVLGAETLLHIEAAVASISWLAAELLVRRWARRAPSGKASTSTFASPNMNRVALRFYGAQMLGAAYGPNMAKLLVTRMLDVAQTAALGVALSVADTLRNYMPAHLLGGWVRPIMVARYVGNRDLAELSQIANVVFKLNLLGLLPAAALFAVVGDQLLGWLTASRYATLGTLLALLVCGVVLQSAHLLLSMIALTLEQPGVSLSATAAAATTIPLMVLATSGFGVVGAAFGLFLGEFVWVVVGWWLLRRRGFGVTLDGRGAGKLAAAALLGGIAGAACSWFVPATPWWAAGMLLLLTYMLLVLVLRPATPDEVAMVCRVVSPRTSPATTD